MIILDNTTEILELTTTAAVSTDVYVSFADITTTAFTGGAQDTNISTATTTTILSAPAASTQRQVKYVAIRNRSTTASQTVTVKHDTSGTERYLTADVVLSAGETLTYTQDLGWVVKNKTGLDKVIDTTTVGFTGIPFEIYKIGTASEAIGNWYSWQKDSGFPGAYSLGAPGVNGWWVDASQTTNAANPAGATQVGVQQLPNPASGSYYMLPPILTTSTGHLVEVIDVVWYNTGLVVTTTTAQAIAQPGASKPSRDNQGTTNGEGWMAGVLVTTATTNAGAITNMTMSYTDSDGNAGNTATIASFPATAVIGTFVPFRLDAGDRGIRSIESVTLGTSLVTGAVSIIMYRKLFTLPNTIVNMGAIGQAYTTDPTGIRIYNGTAPWFIYRSSATTATTMAGSYRIIER